MPDPITRIIFRRGTELERSGLILNQGEPGFTIDTKRLFVGDGNTVGGIPVGTKFLGFYSFGVEFTNIEQNIYPQINDLAYDKTSNILYALTGNPDGTVSYTRKDNWAPVGINIQADNTTLGRAIDTIFVKTNSLNGRYFTSQAIGTGLKRSGGSTGIDVISISGPGQGLSFDINNNLQIAQSSITNAMLVNMSPFSVKGRLELAGTPVDIGFDQLSFVIAPLIKPLIEFDPSDLTIKTNLEKISFPLDKLMKINGYGFAFNLNAPKYLQNKNSYGLVAQEVEKVLPYSVETMNGIKNINYNTIIPLLVECVKVLNNEIVELKKIITNK